MSAPPDQIPSPDLGSQQLALRPKYNTAGGHLLNQGHKTHAGDEQSEPAAAKDNPSDSTGDGDNSNGGEQSEYLTSYQNKFDEPISAEWSQESDESDENQETEEIETGDTREWHEIYPQLTDALEIWNAYDQRLYDFDLSNYNILAKIKEASDQVHEGSQTLPPPVDVFLYAWEEFSPNLTRCSLTFPWLFWQTCATAEEYVRENPPTETEIDIKYGPNYEMTEESRDALEALLKSSDSDGNTST